ncbi:MAG: hypothetical protein IT374_10970 [Polyangiaceae bacterium]|nr:hypothetical protein [Polyangiaceae bacterium]
MRRGPRATFARDFPRDAELDALVDAFEAGDYAAVRARAPELAARASDPEVRRAATELRARLEPDPLAKSILYGTALLLAFLVVWFYTHRVHGP